MANRGLTKTLATVLFSFGVIIVVLLLFQNRKVNTVKATSAGIEQEDSVENTENNTDQDIKDDTNTEQKDESQDQEKNTQENQEDSNIEGSNEEDSNKEESNQEESTQKDSNKEESNQEQNNIAEVKDFNALIKQAIIDNYDNLIKGDSTFSEDNVYVMLDSISDLIIEKHAYKEQTLEEFYNVLKDNKDYTISLINTCFKYLSEQEANSAYEQIKLRISDNIGTDAKDINEKAEQTNDNEKDLEQGYLKAINKSVRVPKIELNGEKINTFREYEVTMGVNVYEAKNGTSSTKTDIVILIDNSDSMAHNFDDAIKTSKNIVDTLIPYNYDANQSDATKIAIVAFSEKPLLIADFTSSRSELLDKINTIEKPFFDKDNDKFYDFDEHGTNIQSALIGAKQILGIGDDKVSDDRSKNIILLSDGIATTRRTDIWNYSENIFVPSNTINSDTNLSASGIKKWTYLTPAKWDNKAVSETINLPNGESFIANEEETGYKVVNEKQKQLNNQITALEAQLLNYQGVNVYPICFSSDDNDVNFMRELSRSLNEQPNFSDDVLSNPITSFDTTERENMFYSANQIGNFINNLYTKINVTENNQFEKYIITETLNSNFEFVPNEFVISKKPFGEESISELGKVSFENNSLVWQFPTEFSEGEYFITYRAKAKADSFALGASKKAYGEQAEEAPAITDVSNVRFTDESKKPKEFNFDSLKVPVAPNLKIDFKVLDELLLAGDETVLVPTIVAGTGYYAYLVSENDNKLIEVPTLKQSILDNQAIPNVNVKDTTPGAHEYKLIVKDLVSGQVVEQLVNTDVLQGKLTVDIIDVTSNSKVKPPFEAKLTAQKDEQTKIFNLIGIGKRDIAYSNYNNFVTRGTSIKAEPYVPYGYELVSVEDSDGDNDGVVKIDIQKNDTEVTGFEKSITIKIKKLDNPSYFYDWTWIFKNGSGSINMFE